MVLRSCPAKEYIRQAEGHAVLAHVTSFGVADNFRLQWQRSGRLQCRVMQQCGGVHAETAWVSLDQSHSAMAYLS